MVSGGADNLVWRAVDSVADVAPLLRHHALIPHVRAVALSAGKPSQAQLNASARKALEAVYAQRHDGSTDGIEDTIKSASAASSP